MTMPARTGTVAFYGTLSAVVLSAIPYGTESPLYISALCVLVCFFGALRIVSELLSERSFCISQPTILLPLAGILLLAVVQMLPLPFSSSPISFDPYETKIFILSFATVIVAFETLAHLMTDRRRLAFLIGTVLFVAFASSLFGVLRSWVLDDRLGVSGPLLSPGSQSYAQFINRNHFVFLIEMALGLTLGLLFKGRLTRAVKFALVILIAIFGYSAIAAGSRGGVISCAALTAASVFFHFLTMRKSELPGSTHEYVLGNSLTTTTRVAIATIFCFLTIGLAIFAIAFAGGDDLIGRMERMENEVSETRMNRLAIWRSTVPLIADHPFAGVGFGAYYVAINRYVEQGGGWRMEQAHNEYLEIVANGGIVALVLFVIAAVFIFRRSMATFALSDPLVRSGCFGAMIGTLGVLIHSTVDYGLHILVNALTFAILAVIATSQVKGLTHRHKTRVYE